MSEPASSFVGEYIQAICQEIKDDKHPAPNWPPDLFAIAASILVKSRTYPYVLGEWPPEGLSVTKWEERARRVGSRWKRDWNRLGEQCEAPASVRGAWRELLKLWHYDFEQDTSGDGRRTDLATALLQLMAYSDQACELLMFLTPKNGFSTFAKGRLEINDNSSLCRDVPETAVRVLPKSHCPLTGFTIRSLSHHLAIYPPSELRPQWMRAPLAIDSADTLRLLIIPWPYTLSPDSFYRVDSRFPKMPGGYGHFSYAPAGASAQPEALRELLKELLGRAAAAGTPADGIILPELALTQGEFDNLFGTVREVCRADGRTRFLLAGVGEPASVHKPGTNIARFAMVYDGKSFQTEQAKHHRWQITEDQIAQYGIGLAPASDVFWECIDLHDRTLTFLACHPRLTFATLICEDLARPDPVGDLLRAVGPDLIIALLADAPQLKQRWPGRFASALTADPGSSVLTITSLGMAEMSKPKPGETPRNRVIALWSSSAGSEEIELGAGKQGVLLELKIGQRTEHSADGRSDNNLAGNVTLKAWQTL